MDENNVNIKENAETINLRENLVTSSKFFHFESIVGFLFFLDYHCSKLFDESCSKKMYCISKTKIFKK